MLANSASKSASTRPVILRRRPDLGVTTDRYDGQTYYMIKDPVALRYFRFREEEYRILDLLDGHRSLQEVKKTFESEFKPQRLTLRELQGFIGQLHDSGLVLSDAPGQGEQLLKRSNERNAKQRKSTLLNPLYIKLPGFDPEQTLQAMYPWFRWIFTPAGVLGAMLLMFSALLLVTVNFSHFRSKPEMESFYAFFTVYNIIWFWIAMGLVKVIHEFGHGLTCTHFGGECHEMGVLLLCFSPGMYCNVSDAWMLPNKWHRMWISAAGIYVEVVLASIATWVWWYTSPGIVHNIAFSTMIVCSVNTALVNANPLMRFDGYYMMLDWLEIPNLRQKSFQLVQTMFAEVCLGIETRKSAFMPKSGRWMFVIYAVATYLYMGLVTMTIVWFLYSFLKPYKLGALGGLLAVAALFSLIVLPVYRLIVFLCAPGRTVSVNKLRLTLTCAALAGLVVAILYVPVPLRVFSVMTVEPKSSDVVYISVPGTLKELYVAPGQLVEAGTVLAVLENPQLVLDYERLRRHTVEMEAAVKTYLALDKPGEMRQAQDALADTRRQLEKRMEQLARLRLVAPRTGWVIPPPERPEQSLVEDESRLPVWQRNLLNPENIGAQLDAGTLFCSVGDRRDMEAVLIIDQGDIEFVKQDQAVQVQLEAFPLRTLNGKISELSQRELESSPIQLSTRGGGELATATDQTGNERPRSAAYQARVPLTDPEGLLQAGFRGRARIDCGTRTSWEWIWRYLTQTFHFRT